MLHIGIDPGKNGVIVILKTNKSQSIEDIIIEPIPKIEGSKNKLIDEHALNDIFLALKTEEHHIVLEDVHAMHNVAASATFSFGDICGLLRGMIIAHGLSFTKIPPKLWQAEMFQGIPEMRKPDSVRNTKKGNPITVRGKIDTKPMSIAAAKRLFPKVKLTLGKTDRATKDQDGVSDALLMAEFSRRKFK